MNSQIYTGNNQKIYCWGRNASGELGGELGADSKNVEIPTYLRSFPEEVVEITSGKQHTVFLLKNGLVYSCGSDDFKQLGRNETGGKLEQIKRLENMAVKQVACGEAFTLVLNTLSELRAFGDNQKGQTGDVELGKSSSKLKLIRNFSPGLTNTFIVKADCGASHCLALTASGKIYSWGDNEYGQLGLGEKQKYVTTPTEVVALNQLPVYMIAAGGSHSFALSISGTMFGWGKNRFGQLGIGDAKDRDIPVLLGSLRSKYVRYVCCGEEHTAVLTKLGQVFTFGCGTKGQLGHNTTDKEVNPKQVVELMGSTVTQISCGRWHTLAYIQNSKRLYAFGQNKFGQLGNGTFEDKSTPTPVQSTWTTSRSEINHYIHNEDQMSVDDDDEQKSFQIYKIFSGGNQNFAVAVPKKGGPKPLDFREIQLDDRTTKFLTESRVSELVNSCKDDSDKDRKKQALNEIFMIFSSASCLNGSFLDHESHETTGLSTHGLRPSVLRRALVKLLAVKSIKEKISDAIRQHLFWSLHRSPCDMEAMRVYLMLPEITIYERPYNESWICDAFAERVMLLDHAAKNLLCSWWTKIPASFFSRIIKALKFSVEEEMKTFPNISKQCVSSLYVLKMVNQVNNAADGLVPYDMLYTPCIQQKIDIGYDYEVFFHSNGKEFCFCQYMFVFDVKAKADILKTDANLKMAQIVKQTLMFSITSNPYLVFHIRRGARLLQDTLREIQRYEQFTSEFMKPLKIVFEGEEGIDAGGPRKEFFLLLIKEIFDRKYGMFVEIESSRTVWFDSQTFEDPSMYFLVGLICGLAIYNSIIIDVHFPPVLYKKLLDRKTTLDDFRGFDPVYARTLQYLLDYDEETGDITEIFSQNFQCEELTIEGYLNLIDLVENGSDISLTADNREEYVEAVINYKLNKSVEPQFSKFRDGFYTVCDKNLLTLWHPQEVMEMIVGCEDYDDFMKLKDHTKYEGYTRSDIVIVWFWELLEEFDLELKKKFLSFLTGSDKIPVQGIRSIQMQIKPLPNSTSQDLLPQASTCFNIFFLPRYRTKEIMSCKVKLALNEFGKGFGLE